MLVLQSLNCRFAQVGKARVEKGSIPVLHECFSHKYVMTFVSEIIDLPKLTTISLGQSAMEFDLHKGQSLTMNSSSVSMRLITRSSSAYESLRTRCILEREKI